MISHVDPLAPYVHLHRALLNSLLLTIIQKSCPQPKPYLMGEYLIEASAQRRFTLSLSELDEYFGVLAEYDITQIIPGPGGLQYIALTETGRQYLKSRFG
jgi:hypothetical protein